MCFIVQEKKLDMQTAALHIFPGCATTHRREMRRQLESPVHKLVLLNRKMTLISGCLESYCLRVNGPLYLSALHNITLVF